MFYFTVYLDPLPEAAYWHNEVCLDTHQLHKLLAIFKPDFKHQQDSNSYWPTNAINWSLDDFKGKYVRLLWEVTAPEDMHELANEEDLFAIKHIVNDDDSSTFFV